MKYAHGSHSSTISLSVLLNLKQVGLTRKVLQKLAIECGKAH